MAHTFIYSHEGFKESDIRNKPVVFLGGHSVATSKWRDSVIDHISKHYKGDVTFVITLYNPKNPPKNKKDSDLLDWETYLLYHSTVIALYYDRDRINSFGTGTDIEFGYYSCFSPDKLVIGHSSDSQAMERIELIANRLNIKYTTTTLNVAKAIVDKLNEFYNVELNNKYNDFIKKANRFIESKAVKEYYNTLYKTLKVRVTEYVKSFKSKLTSHDKKYLEYLLPHLVYVNLFGTFFLREYLGSKYEAPDLLLHDLSKYNTGTEWNAYVDYWYKHIKTKAYDDAWVHHILNNDHHWNHFALLQDELSVVTADMSIKQIIHMLADWLSVNFIYNKKCDLKAWMFNSQFIASDNTWKILNDYFGIQKGYFLRHTWPKYLLNN